jgi:hypothetical protein
MKKCPQCNRTYADDGFTFCLEDGALLSAPYDPTKEEPLSTIQVGPPPTMALPSQQDSADTASSQRDKQKPVPLAPTIESPRAPAGPQEPKQVFPPRLDLSIAPRRKSRLPYVGVAILLLLIIGGSLLYVLSRTLCPKINTTIHCSPFSELRRYPFSEGAGCQLLIPASSQKITKTIWTVSSGKVSYQSQYEAAIETPGLAGREITVTATSTISHWPCSTTASTSFIVPATTP